MLYIATLPAINTTKACSYNLALCISLHAFPKAYFLNKPLWQRAKALTTFQRMHTLHTGGQWGDLTGGNVLEGNFLCVCVLSDDSGLSYLALAGTFPCSQSKYFLPYTAPVSKLWKLQLGFFGILGSACYASGRTCFRQQVCSIKTRFSIFFLLLFYPEFLLYARSCGPSARSTKSSFKEFPCGIQPHRFPWQWDKW